MREAVATLKRVFGYDDFRPGQAEIVEAVLAGEDVLAVMPTGSGKSLCFQLPAILAGGRRRSFAMGSPSSSRR